MLQSTNNQNFSHLHLIPDLHFGVVVIRVLVVGLVSVRVAVLRPGLGHHRALVVRLAAEHRLHVHQAHVLRVRDDALAQEGLDYL